VVGHFGQSDQCQFLLREELSLAGNRKYQGPEASNIIFTSLCNRKDAGLLSREPGPVGGDEARFCR
jgi:hypothetical protein